MDPNESTDSYTCRLPNIEDFKILKPISRGAYGKVFLGQKNDKPDKYYAIKVMKKSEMINKNMVHQVNRERNALALSRSPYCVQLFYSLQSSSCVYLVMEYLIGGDLKSLLSMSGFFNEFVATFYIAEVALALEYLHKHGIIHRDIKPDNMLLTAQGHVRLTDFGLSRISVLRDLEIEDLVNISPNIVNKRTPGQILSLTSHLSFGSCEQIKCTPEMNKSRELSETPVLPCRSLSTSRRPNALSFGSHVDQNSSVESTFFTCSSYSNSRGTSELSDNNEHSYLSRSNNENMQPLLIQKLKNAPCSTGISQELDILDLSDIDPLGTPNRFSKRSLKEESPLRGVLKSKSLSAAKERPVVMMSTPVSAVKRFKPDSYNVLKKTRFNLDYNLERDDSRMAELSMSPIVTPSVKNVAFKTPKSVRKGKLQSSNIRILGTPDYLAPELLLKQEYGNKVDWWALGVCMYEFMTGVLPFNDDTLQLVFANILNRQLDWPEGEEALTDDAREGIEALLTLDPNARPNGEELKRFSIFKNINWDNLYESEAPFIPQPDNDMDTTYFSARNNLQNLKVSAFDL
ncbi:serine/threonine-protein kinase greatwall [Cimex lectularius]|uniref:Serine/threonine-protein kinase greatwall n=1 Tax=Cimex lectularius TaxID=79782 RepID=A0A8I6RJB2_CIMLE|nr:serine/threonine-protein kinase greatwall [Cimex lectularius]